MNTVKRFAKGFTKLDRYLEGENNLEKGINDDLASVRHLKACNETCRSFKDEKIDFLKVDDEAVSGLSGKMCEECGCVLSYKLRLTKEKCPRGKW